MAGAWGAEAARSDWGQRLCQPHMPLPTQPLCCVYTPSHPSPRLVFILPVASLPRVLNASAGAHQQLCKESSLDRQALLELLEPVPEHNASGKRMWAMAPPSQQSP